MRNDYLGSGYQISSGRPYATLPGAVGGTKHLPVELEANWQARWPTPTSSLGTKAGRITSRKARDGGTLVEAISATIYPTPKTNDICGGSGAAAKVRQNNSLSDDEKRSMLAGNGGQLNADWVEALMGWPVGWTRLDGAPEFADWRGLEAWPPDWEANIRRLAQCQANRAARLKAIGNGQVPQSMVLAWRTLAA